MPFPFFYLSAETLKWVVSDVNLTSCCFFGSAINAVIQLTEILAVVTQAQGRRSSSGLRLPQSCMLYSHMVLTGKSHTSLFSSKEICFWINLFVIWYD